MTDRTETTEPTDADLRLAARILQRIGYPLDIDDIKCRMAADEIMKDRQERLMGVHNER